MITSSSEKPRILIKSKNLQLIFDYCVETKTEFTVIPRNTNDDWEIELNIKSIIDAIKWGMFLKSNKIELIENSNTTAIINSTKTNLPKNGLKSSKTLEASKKIEKKSTTEEIKPLFEAQNTNEIKEPIDFTLNSNTSINEPLTSEATTAENKNNEIF